MPAPTITLPYPYVFCNDPVIIDLEYYGFYPDKSYIELVFTGTAVANKQFSLTVDGHTWIFYTQDNPELQPFKIDSAPATTTELGTALFDRWKNHAEITDIFKVTAIADGVRLESDLALSISKMSVLVDGFLDISVHQGNGSFGLVNMQSYVEIWWQHHNEVREKIVAINPRYRDEDGHTGPVDVQDFLMLVASLPSNQPWGIALESFRYYFFKYADMSGAIPHADILTKTVTGMAIHGGHSPNWPKEFKERLENQNALLLHRTPIHYGGIGFAGEQDYWQRVHPRQPNWLYQFSKDMDAPITVEAIIYYQQTNSTAPAPTVVSLTLFPYGTPEGVSWMATGFEQLSLDGYATSGEQITHYDIKITANGEQYGTRYELDYDFAAYNGCILFDNGIGGMETIYLSEEVSANFKITKKRFKNVSGTRSFYQQFGDEEFTVSTGWQSYQYMKILRQVLLGKAWYLIDDNRIEIEILTTQMVTRELDDLHAATIKFRLAKDTKAI